MTQLLKPQPWPCLFTPGLLKSAPNWSNHPGFLPTSAALCRQVNLPQTSLSRHCWLRTQGALPISRGSTHHFPYPQPHHSWYQPPGAFTYPLITLHPLSYIIISLSFTQSLIDLYLPPGSPHHSSKILLQAESLTVPVPVTV